MSIELKVKVKSLAAEARIIKQEERRTSGLRRASLTEHRRHVVRPMARASLLAYGYLQGRPYRALERTNKPNKPGPAWSEVERMIKRYGPPKHNVSFDEWRKAE